MWGMGISTRLPLVDVENPEELAQARMTSSRWLNESGDLEMERHLHR